LKKYNSKGTNKQQGGQDIVAPPFRNRAEPFMSNAQFFPTKFDPCAQIRHELQDRDTHRIAQR
jgi:hypothetical protein